MLGRDAESIADIHRALGLEPRHFAALAEFGEICLTGGENEAALLRFRAALRVHPRLEGVTQTCQTLLGDNAA